MIYTDLTRLAMKVSYQAHQNQKDLAGTPYIFHIAHVAEHMDDEISTCVALLHDVVEDTAVALSDLEKEFPIEVTQAVDLLTRKPGVSYFEYIEQIKLNPVGRKVKLADLAHNADMSRFESSTNQGDEYAQKSYRSLQSRYQKAMQILQSK